MKIAIMGFDVQKYGDLEIGPVCRIEVYVAPASETGNKVVVDMPNANIITLSVLTEDDFLVEAEILAKGFEAMAERIRGLNT